MKALSITPGKGNLKIIDTDEPQIQFPDDIKLKVLQVGICGTDREEVEGGRADAPSNEDHLIIGHEMFGRVVDIGKDVSKVKKGDYALFIVRRGCGKCYPCLNDRSDMCYTGQYKERGIKGLHGYQAEFVVDSEKYIVKVPEEIASIGVLAEPMSVIEKAIDDSLLLQEARIPGVKASDWLEGRKALVAGLGPVGLLSAVALRLKNAKVFGLDIVDENSKRPSLLKAIGGEYIDGRQIKTTDIDEKLGDMDFVLEAAGITKLEFQLLDTIGINGIYVLSGIPGGNRPVNILGDELIRKMVLMNHVWLGSVNASIQHYDMAISDLQKARIKWKDIIEEIITDKFHYTDFTRAFEVDSSKGIKTVIEWDSI
ncbi:MAG: glucose 1-dehydrogenase [Ignavibacteriaceae bacterium]|jgi:threonine dehydrogenase-like Zn-dependent dehydrogenase